ncbi:hypothetical protein [Clostridium sp.]|uniref:hypothetical protein n=1 Tax=Clostridium sp. TaxID=1506 RepID=UPI00290BA6C4|nr:hypothetical protein [Clostridium sp.]MDU5107771.1 hypothetical protein [Clostridium sp.]
MEKIRLNIDIKLEIDYDTINKEFIVVSCNPVILNQNQSSMIMTHTLSETQIKFGILTLGAKIGKNIPKGKDILIKVNGNLYSSEKQIITHRSVKGRIDGLTAFYKTYDDFIAGTSLQVDFDINNNILNLTTIQI